MQKERKEVRPQGRIPNQSENKPEQQLPIELEQEFNQPPKDYEAAVQNLQALEKIENSLEYIYLRPSDKMAKGTIIKKTQFDVRFEQIRDTMVTRGLLSVVTTLYPEVYRYNKAHPGSRAQPTVADKEQLDRQLKILKPDFQISTERDIRYTWIGHSTAVLQIGPDNFMIDPIFTQRASPIQLAGPKRFRPPPCTIAQLPKIDVVFISHDHYDHLNEPSLRQLHSRHQPLFIAGLGTGDVLPKKSKRLLMDWMDQSTINVNGRPYKITFVPTCHWGKRGVNDLNTRLWGGVVIDTPFGQRIYYSGDTGYCPVFKELGRKFGPFDLTILPIGAYEPRLVLKPQHVNPQEAVIVHKQLKSRQSVAVHWGTFPLGTQGFCQAKYDLADARKKLGVPDDQFIHIAHGETVVFRKGQTFKKQTT